MIGLSATFVKIVGFFRRLASRATMPFWKRPVNYLEKLKKL